MHIFSLDNKNLILKIKIFNGKKHFMTPYMQSIYITFAFNLNNYIKNIIFDRRYYQIMSQPIFSG